MKIKIKNNKGFQRYVFVLLALSFFVLFIGGITYVFRDRASEKVMDFIENDQKLIGGSVDEGGCLVGAGYSWCEIKNKCLRIWEEPCVESDPQEIVENYLNENISILSLEKEVLGGKFFITSFEFVDESKVVVDYEDGHIALSASVLFVVENDEVEVQKFTIIKKY
jgi:hypothetical protein